jgi:PAS domain S-box-containing protein
MLLELIQSPELAGYTVHFSRGRTIFMEEDDSQDLYILVAGELEVLKGNKKIMEITAPGSFFGEISFLLGTKRTATIKALNAVQAVRIPKTEMTNFLRQFPEIAGEISKVLAQRLSATSQVLYGLKEFCDKLPDAVVVTDREGRITTWNSAAERLYGRNWQSMHQACFEEVYVEKEEYRDLLKEVQADYTVTERILRIRHPEKGVRYISTSTNTLYDPQHHFQGIIALGRDVTSQYNQEQKFRKAFYWAVSIFGIFLVLILGLFWGYPQLMRQLQSFNTQQTELKSRLARDYFLLKTLLSEGLDQGQRSKTSSLLQDYFKLSEETAPLYTGILLLDAQKKVFDAYFPSGNIDLSRIIDSSYAGIEFEGYTDSLHRVLTLYRVDSFNPMGHKEIEVAFQLKKESRLQGWIVFQMDQDRLRNVYHIDETGLKKFRFKEP